MVFLGVSALVICTPGPDTALTIRNTLGGGRRHGVLTGAGVASGQLVWTVAASVGLAGLVKTSELAFQTIKLVGAAYLVYLGLQSLWGAWRGHNDQLSADPRRTSASAPRALVQGMINDLANPKMAAFFLSLLPQFAPSGDVPVSLALGALFCVMTFVWLTFYALLIDRVRRLFDRSRVRQILELISGSVLIGLGVRIAVEPA